MFNCATSNPFLRQQAPEEPGRVYSEATTKCVDQEVEQLLEQARQQSRATLTECRAVLERLAQPLLQEEVLERDQVLAIIGDEQAALFCAALLKGKVPAMSLYLATSLFPLPDYEGPEI